MSGASEPFWADDEQLFHDPIREALPTIQELIGVPNGFGQAYITDQPRIESWFR